MWPAPIWDRVDQLVDRMGKITASLPLVRPLRPLRQPAPASPAVEAALFLVEPRKGKGPLTLIRDLPTASWPSTKPGWSRSGESVSNALDAMQGQQERVLALHGEAGDSHYGDRVHDKRPWPATRHHAAPV